MTDFKSLLTTRWGLALAFGLMMILIFSLIQSELNPRATESTQSFLKLQLPDHEGRLLRLSPEVFGMISGPEDRRRVFAGLLSHPERQKTGSIERVLHLSFCRPGLLRQDFALPEGLLSATLTLANSADATAQVQSWEVACSKN